jgi:hypothetical protein
VRHDTHPVGRVVTVRIEDTVVHCLLDGKIIKTFPRRHTGEVRNLNVDKKHKSRRAADARRRAATNETDEQAKASR